MAPPLRGNAVAQQARDEYQKLLDESQGALEGISGSLQTRLMQWAHPDTSLRVSWQQDPDKSVKVEEPFAKIIAGEGTFEGEIARFGHGLQRTSLLALLQELATQGDTMEPRLILGCEEPELYEHPPQARHLASVLNSLATGGSQVLVTTHSLSQENRSTACDSCDATQKRRPRTPSAYLQRKSVRNMHV